MLHRNAIKIADIFGRFFSDLLRENMRVRIDNFQFPPIFVFHPATPLASDLKEAIRL